MSEREKIQARDKAIQALSMAMLSLHNLKGHASSSGRKQLAEIIVEIGKQREKMGNVDQ